MRVGIMQPYFIPYIGYWQLLNAVDQYVIYDDVNYIKGGWINRNRILIDGQPKYFNVPMIGASPYKLINEIEVNNDKRIIEKNMRMIEYAYKKAPCYAEVSSLMERILNCGRTNLAEYITESIRLICDYLEIRTKILVSSNIKKDCNLKGQDKVLAICKLLDATEYYNAIGGQELYSFSAFKEQGIDLKFLKTDNIVYSQFGNDFQPNLSILDVMMFNSVKEIDALMSKYLLISEDAERGQGI